MKVNIKELKPIIKEAMMKAGAIRVDKHQAERDVGAMSGEDIKKLVLSDPNLISQLAIKFFYKSSMRFAKAAYVKICSLSAKKQKCVMALHFI